MTKKIYKSLVECSTSQLSCDQNKPDLYLKPVLINKFDMMLIHYTTNKINSDINEAPLI